ncbi:MAG TPA: 1-deoxy-D-xylulose-5-phosphate synthase N-terminal domain-containing protein [Thermomicrobiaceae bacterium]|nr:1-deoxy-D-xylulose-5-phosphate synthase N-terminal domain-containing protein [Thermomicrobiaceae bacterium]
MAQQAIRTEEPDISSASPDQLAALDAIQRRILWLATNIVHHANHLRPNPDKTKVGGHQASSASIVTILTALYFHYLRAGDRVSIKPHASPAFHAVQYLLGNLDRDYLPTLRAYKGLQAYPSRTKDPEPVDFSTGSVGLGAVAPLFAALAHQYSRAHFGVGAVNSDRFVAVLGDAELDEGNVWEAVAEEALSGLGNALWIVDLNRQSLDRVVPGVRAARLKALFQAAGWQVVEAKYGHRLRAVFAAPGGAALRRRIDEMSNEEYQALIRLDGAALRARLIDGTDLGREELAQALAPIPDEALPGVIGDLGGHDLVELLRCLEATEAEPKRPSVLFAYTIKGWGLPIAGDPLNHSALLTNEQMVQLRERLGVPAEDEWAGFAADSAEGRLIAAARERLSRSQEPVAPPVAAASIPEAIGVRHPNSTSTQEALGRILPRVGELPQAGERLVTVAPDVATSTHLGGWINRAGIFAPSEQPDYEGEGPRVLRWRQGPAGRHIELGISEMNLFMALGQLGLSYELVGQHLLPVGTVYDPFICRGLDSLIYSLYVGSKMVFAGTPSGMSLSPEGGAHQSSVTASLGIELPGLISFEPCFASETEWVLLEALRQCCDREHGLASYLRLSTKPIDQTLLEPALARLGEAELRRQVLEGGYRLVDRRETTPQLPASQVVQLVTAGAMVPEAVAAAARLAEEEIAANVIAVTSPSRLYRALRELRRQGVHRAETPQSALFQRLILPEERRAPIVTVHDAASHALAFLGGVYGAPVISLGFDEFGQSGARADLYHVTEIDAEAIAAAALHALELK